MFLSKLYLPWEYAKDAYKVHRQLWRLFPGHDSKKSLFLFRVEQRIPRKGLQILLQSKIKPDDTIQYIHFSGIKEIKLKIKKEQILRFRILCNPIKTIKDQKGRLNTKGEVKKCRVPLIKLDDQHKWINKKFIDFAVIQSIIINGAEPIVFYKDRERRRGKIQPILYDGIFIVTDEAKLENALYNGIGPAKAFGCGLLSLACI